MFRRSRNGKCAVVVFLSVFIVACSSGGVGAPIGELPSSPVSTSATSGNGQGSENGAPAVSEPLDVSKFKSNICLLLGDKQLEELGVTARGTPNAGSATGPTCNWRDANGRSGVDFGATLVTLFRQGLSSVYEQRGRSYKFFEEIPSVEGYPGVFVDRSVDKYLSTCQLMVGISDRQVLSVGVSSRGGAVASVNHGKPCGVTLKLAQEMVRTIKGSA